MLKQAEQFAEEDKQALERTQAKNGLESYIYNVRNTTNEPQLKDKLEAADKEALEKIVKEGIEWLDSNTTASTDELKDKQKEIEEQVNPIMTKIYSAAGGAPGGMPAVPLAPLRCCPWR